VAPPVCYAVIDYRQTLGIFPLLYAGCRKQLKHFKCTLEEQRLLVYGMLRQKKFTLDEHEANDTRKKCQLRHHARHMELVVDECAEGGGKNPTRERRINFLQMARHLGFK